MTLNFRGYLLKMVLLVLLIANASFAFAQEDLEKVVLESEPEPSEQEVFLDRLEHELDFAKADYRQLLNSLSDTQGQLDHVHEENQTLAQQIGNLESYIDITSKKLINVVEEVVETENEIALLEEEIEIGEILEDKQKELLKDYMVELYEFGDVDAMTLLLAEGTTGDNLQQIEYISLLSTASSDLLAELSSVTEVNSEKKGALDEKKKELRILELEIEQEKEQLELQKSSKERLLAVTEGQELIYGQLLEESLAQQEEAIEDIKKLSDALNFFKRLAEEGEEFSPDQYGELFDENSQALYDFQTGDLGEGENDFIWPVKPGRGISAFYRNHGDGYQARFGVVHNAVDIPVPQGTPFRTIGDGFVYNVTDNGYGYSYIIIAHRNGLMSVYGHVNKALVEEGMVVPKGTIIGLSGGMPGTIGAGYMTTGPHIHLEIHLDGKHVDPMYYLPLSVFSQEQAEQFPEKYYELWKAAVLKVARFAVD